jgi:Flp pilus assembly protein TadD
MDLKNVRKRDAVILGATLLTAAVGVGAIHRGCSYQDVWLVNGLELPVEVEIDGARRPLAPGSRVEVTLREGVHHVRVLSSDGKVMDEEPFDVPATTDVVAYNVAGAAPLYLERIEYRYVSSGSNQDDQNSVEFFAGVTRIARDRVQFVFKEPPSKISVKSGESTTRYYFTMAPGGFRATAGYLDSKNEVGKLARLYRAVSIATPGSRDLVDRTSEMIELAEGGPAALRFLREMRDLRPDDAAVHMEYQYRMQRLGRGEEVLAEYRALSDKNKDKASGSPLFGVLLSRVEPKEQAGALLAGLVKSHPGDALVLSAAAYHAYVTGDYAQSAELYARLQDTPDHERNLGPHLGALVGIGKVQEAVDLAARYASAATALSSRAPLVYGLVARLPGASPPEPPMTHINRLGTAHNAPDWKLFSAAFAGEPLSVSDLMSLNDPSARQAIEIHLAASRDPAEAWELCSKASPTTLRMMSSSAAVLLGAEFARAGDPELGEKLLERDVGQWTSNAALFAYVKTGEEPPNFWRIDPEIRAALAFVRARHLMSLGQPAATLLAEAERADLLKAVVARARASWPPVAGPGAAGKKDEKGEKGAKVATVDLFVSGAVGAIRRVAKPAP